ncbi:MAG: lantibiotic dehydratase C-terminal domain-containing protein [Nitrososphaerales archaeon]|jgi:hypothetical protein
MSAHGGLVGPPTTQGPVNEVEYWVEINLVAELKDQDTVLLEVLRPYVQRLRKSRTLITWHFFREPEIRFRIRVRSKDARIRENRMLSEIAKSLVKKRLVSEWHFGSHGEKGEIYIGEEDRYGKNGWKVTQEYIERGAETALDLLELKRKSRLENPLWARGLGNPWEGGDRNPWREKKDNPLVYHWSRYVHLFTNQMGLSIDEETRLCRKQAERYNRVSKELGIKW